MKDEDIVAYAHAKEVGRLAAMLRAIRDIVFAPPENQLLSDAEAQQRLRQIAGVITHHKESSNEEGLTQPGDTR